MNVLSSSLGFDGLDVQWTPPTHVPIELKYRFTAFCKEFRSYFQSQGLLVTATLSGDITIVDHSYEVEKISRSLYLINVMSYDYYGTDSTFAVHHTDARYSYSINDKNIDNSIKHWVNRNADTRKLNLGLATFARTYYLKKPERFWNLGSAVYVGGGRAGKITKTKGMLAYYEVCSLKFINKKCTSSSLVNAPYGSYSENFIGYDDPESIKYKIKAFMAEYNLKGFMISNLDLDDFSNHCGHGSYPLVKAARDAANNIEEENLKFECDDVTATLPPTVTTTTRKFVPITWSSDKNNSSFGVQLRYNVLVTFIAALVAFVKLL